MASTNPGGDGGDKYGGARPKDFSSRKSKKRIEKVKEHKHEKDIQARKLEEERCENIIRIATKGIQEAKDDKTREKFEKMRAKAKDDKETAFMERMIIQDFRNRELGIPTLSFDEQQRKERQRALIEEELLKGEEEEKRAAKEKTEKKSRKRRQRKEKVDSQRETRSQTPDLQPERTPEMPDLQPERTPEMPHSKPEPTSIRTDTVEYEPDLKPEDKSKTRTETAEEQQKPTEHFESVQEEIFARLEMGGIRREDVERLIGIAESAIEDFPENQDRMSREQLGDSEEIILERNITTQGLEQADVDAGSHGGSHQRSNLSSDEDNETATENSLSEKQKEILKNVDVGPQKGTSERRNYFHSLLTRVSKRISDKRTELAVNKLIKQEHKIYKAKKEAILREKAILERAHMKLVSLHKDAIKAHSKKDTNVKILFTGQDPVIINDLSKEHDEDEDKSDRKETNDFLATMLSGFLEASSRHLPSIDPRPRSPKISNTSSRSKRDDQESTLIGLTNWGWGGTSRKDYTESGGGGRRHDSSDDEDIYTAGTGIHRGDGNRGNGGGGGTGGHGEHCPCLECWESRHGKHRFDGR